MDSPHFSAIWPTRLIAGLAAGGAIAAVDNLAFEGEASPMIVVALLFASTASAGALWGDRAWLASAAAWAWVPGAHLAKRLLGLPDTIHPNTSASLQMLAGFTLVVAGAGTGVGLLLRRFAADPPGIAPPSGPGASPRP